VHVTSRRRGKTSTDGHGSTSQRNWWGAGSLGRARTVRDIQHRFTADQVPSSSVRYT